MKEIMIYTKSWCSYCRSAKNLLDDHKINYHEIDVTADHMRFQEMVQRSDKRTVPQIFLDGRSIGGFTELVELMREQDIIK